MPASGRSSRDGLDKYPSFSDPAGSFSKDVDSPGKRAENSTFAMFSLHITPLALIPVLFALQQGPAPLADALSLPTPMEHYQGFNVEVHAQTLLTDLMRTHPRVQVLLPSLLAGMSSGSGELPADFSALLTELPWQGWEEEILEQLIHRSRVLEMITPELAKWRPFVHDSLIYFLHQLGPEEVLERFLSQLRISADVDRGSRVLEFAAGTPILQKIGQILAHNPSIPEDLRLSLQQLENSILTTDAGTLVSFIRADLGEERIAAYRFQLESQILAEATVGAVIAGSLTLPGEQRARRIVCKVIKPEAERGLRQELQAFDSLGLYLQENSAFYELGDFPLGDLFNEIGEAFAREILVVEEQRNLARAADYYENNPRILVPEMYEISTPNVTIMDYVEGVKVTEAFPGDQKARVRVARRLSSALTYDVIFNRRDLSIFHGDPHAGNVYHVTAGDGDRYRLALLDWGLLGEFTLQERKQLVQLLFGIQLGHREKLKRNIGVLIEGGLPDSVPEREEIFQIIEDAQNSLSSQGSFVVLEAMAAELAKQGYEVPFNLALFVKSQLTISGILHELDPQLKQDQLVMQKLNGQVMKEFPKRFLYTLSVVGWNSRDFDSLLANGDIMGYQVRKVGRTFGKIFRLPLKAFNP